MTFMLASEVNQFPFFAQHQENAAYRHPTAAVCRNKPTAAADVDDNKAGVRNRLDHFLKRRIAVTPPNPHSSSSSSIKRHCSNSIWNHQRMQLGKGKKNPLWPQIEAGNRKRSCIGSFVGSVANESSSQSDPKKSKTTTTTDGHAEEDDGMRIDDVVVDSVSSFSTPQQESLAFVTGFVSIFPSYVSCLSGSGSKLLEARSSCARQNRLLDPSISLFQATSTSIYRAMDDITMTAAASSSNATTTTTTTTLVDEFTEQILREAKETLAEEPELSSLLHLTVLAPWVKSFEDAVAATVCYRMLLHPQNGGMTTSDIGGSFSGMFCPYTLRGIFQTAFDNNESLEMGHTMKEAVRKDAIAIIDRDPACESLLEVVLFYKGFSALVVHRAARQKWNSAAANYKRSMTALFLQSQASAVFALDIHPGATIGAGILLDHGTGIVIGETAHIGDGCTMLHGVTLGGTGKESGDRHPKIGKHVLIGAGASILGNIVIGDRAKIGAGSVVLRPIPPGATAVGAPAKIIGKTVEEDPASTMEADLKHVSLFHKSSSVVTLSTAPESTSSGDSSLGGGEDSTFTADSTLSDVNASCCCPYRDYAKFALKIAENPPPNSICYCILAKCLVDKGCSYDEILAAFFALDTRNVGYVYQKDVHPEKFTKILVEATSLDAQQVGTVLQQLAIV